jgi:hypothetical protein
VVYRTTYSVSQLTGICIHIRGNHDIFVLPERRKKLEQIVGVGVVRKGEALNQFDEGATLDHRNT